MFPLARRKIIHLPPTWRQGARVLTLDAEQQQFSYVAEVETDTATIRAAILPNFVPHNVRLVPESPCTQDLQSFGQQCVRNPQIQMRNVRRNLRNRQCFYLLQRHRVVTGKASVLWCDLPRLVLELPRRIGEDCG